MTISRQLFPVEITVDRRQLEIVKYFKYLASMTTNDLRCIRQIKSRIAVAKAEYNKKKRLFTCKFVLNLRTKLVKCYIWSILCMVLKLGLFRKQIGNTCRILKCSAGEGGRRSTGPITWEMVLQRIKENRNILHTVKPVLNGISRDQNIFPLKPGFRLIKVRYIQYKKLNQDMQTLTLRWLMSYIYIWSTHSWCF